MRDIKFRAWDSEANIMIYSDHRTRKLYDVYYGFEMNEKGELECRWEGDFTESHVLDGGILDNIMQSTGLKDKNGVQIFEGDIVSMVVVEDKAEYLGDVVFESGCFCLNISLDGTKYKVTALEWKETETIITVIGNIYQNNDLT